MTVQSKPAILSEFQNACRRSSPINGNLHVYNPPENTVPDDAHQEPSTDQIETGEPVESTGKPLRLDQFLKLCGIAETGGHAKVLIQGGEVLLNGEIETRRRKKLSIDDVIEVFDSVLPVADFFSVE